MWVKWHILPILCSFILGNAIQIIKVSKCSTIQNVCRVSSSPNVFSKQNLKRTIRNVQVIQGHNYIYVLKKQLIYNHYLQIYQAMLAWHSNYMGRKTYQQSTTVFITWFSTLPLILAGGAALCPFKFIAYKCEAMKQQRQQLKRQKQIENNMEQNNSFWNQLEDSKKQEYLKLLRKQRKVVVIFREDNWRNKEEVEEKSCMAIASQDDRVMKYIPALKKYQRYHLQNLSQSFIMAKARQNQFLEEKCFAFSKRKKTELLNCKLLGWKLWDDIAP